jgi:hypothetical protein
METENTLWKLSTCTVINNEYNTHNETIHNDNDVTNNEIQEQGQIEDQQQPVMDDDYNNQGNLLRGNDNCLGAAQSMVQVG